jgi:kumamolisin
MANELVPLPGSASPMGVYAVRVGTPDPHEVIEVTVRIKGPALPGTSDFPKRGMDRSDFAAVFSATTKHVGLVESVLAAYQLHPMPGQSHEVSRQLRFSGTIRQVERAFGVRLGIYKNAVQGEFRGRDGIISIPEELAGVVTGVFGLDERRAAHRALVPPAGAGAPLSPVDITAHYDFPPGAGAGQTIAIAEFGRGYQDTDLSAYCDRWGCPTPVVRAIPVFNTNISELPNQASEVMLDVEVIAGLSPQAEIDVYFANPDEQGWIDLLGYLVSEGRLPVSLNISWSTGPEELAAETPQSYDFGGITLSGLIAMTELLSALATLGVTVCVAAGDNGSCGGWLNGFSHVEFPASSPFVLSVGGTEIDGNGDEVAWWDFPGYVSGSLTYGMSGSGAASGGGVSVVFERPWWQPAGIVSNNPHASDGRIVPDVSALAGRPAYTCILNGEVVSGSGTSAAAPLWTALVALINEGLAPPRPTFLAPLLYLPNAAGDPLGSACADVAAGDNACYEGILTAGVNVAAYRPSLDGYPAGPGFDAVSGWGTPNGRTLADNLATQPPVSGNPSGRSVMLPGFVVFASTQPTWVEVPCHGETGACSCCSAPPAQRFWGWLARGDRPGTCRLYLDRDRTRFARIRLADIRHHVRSAPGMPSVMLVLNPKAEVEIVTAERKKLTASALARQHLRGPP